MSPHIATTSLCIVLMSTPALTQTLPDKPPGAPSASAGGLPDKTPYGLPYGAPIDYASAKAILVAAEAEARRRGWPMNIAIVDTHGDLVGFARMDGAQLASVQVSQKKARTAARWRRETRVFYNAYAAGSAYYGTLDGDLAASPGGVPLIADNKIIGAVGCSGGTGDQDALICQTAAESIMRTN